MNDGSENDHGSQDDKISELRKRGGSRTRSREGGAILVLQAEEAEALMRLADVEDPEAQAEEALMRIADVEDPEAQVQTVVLLMDMLLRNRDYAPAVIERVQNYLEVQPLANAADERCDVEMSSWNAPVDPREVEDAFAQLLSDLDALKPGRPGRKPHKISRVYQVIRGRENEAIPLDDFACQLKGVRNPRLRASRDISETNRAFREQGIPLQISGTTRGHDEERTTVYRVRRAPQV